MIPLSTIEYHRVTSANVGDFAAGLVALGHATTGHLTSPEFWVWRYSDSPAGPCTTTVAILGSRVIGRFGSIAVPFLLRGSRTVANVLDDLRILPRHRSWAVYRRLLIDTSRGNVEKGPRPAYSFVNCRSREMNRMLGWDSMVDAPVYAGFLDFAAALRRRPRLAPLAGPARLLNLFLRPRAGRAESHEIRLLERLDPSFDAVLGSGGGATTGIVKDSVYLNWRYADCPKDYRILGAFRDGRPVACLVYFVWDVLGEVRLMELLGGEGSSAPRELLGELCRIGRGEGCSVVRASFPLHSWQGELLSRAGFHRWPTRVVRMSLASFSSELPLGELRFSHGDWF